MTKTELTDILGPSTPGLGSTSVPKRVYLKELFEEWLSRSEGNTDPVVLSFETADTGYNIFTFSRTLYFIKDGTLDGLSDIASIQFEPEGVKTPPGSLSLRTYGIVRDRPGIISNLKAFPKIIFIPPAPPTFVRAPEPTSVRAPEPPYKYQKVLWNEPNPLKVRSIVSDKPGSVRWDRDSPSVAMSLVDKLDLNVEEIIPDVPRWSIFAWMVGSSVGNPYAGGLKTEVIADVPGIVKGLSAPVTVDRSGGALSKFKDGSSKLYLAIIGETFRPIDTPWQTQQFQSDGKWAETKEQAIAKGLPVYFPEGSVISYQGEFDLEATTTVTQPPIVKIEDSVPVNGPNNLHYRVFADRPGINWFRGSGPGEYNFEVKAFNADIGAVQGEDVSGGPEQSNESVIPNNASADQISPHYVFITKQWYPDTAYQDYGDDFYGSIHTKNLTGGTISTPTLDETQKNDGFGSAKSIEEAYRSRQSSKPHFQKSDEIKYAYSHTSTTGKRLWTMWPQWKYIGKRNTTDMSFSGDYGSSVYWKTSRSGDHHAWRLDQSFGWTYQYSHFLIYEPAVERYVVLLCRWYNNVRENEDGKYAYAAKLHKLDNYAESLEQFNIFGTYAGSTTGVVYSFQVSPNPLDANQRSYGMNVYYKYDIPRSVINGYEILGHNNTTTPY